MKHKLPGFARNLARIVATVPFLIFVPTGQTMAADHGPYAMEILVDGVPLDEYSARGKTYVEARRGREYSVRLRNRTPRRVAVAFSVDGLNSIDARTTSASSARKWILGPHETIVLEGWQTGAATARRFFFTGEKDSYGAWLGNTANLGTISAAFFREVDAVLIDGGSHRKRQRRLERWSAPAPGESSAPSRESAEPMAKGTAQDDELAATGIGREFGHRVRQVRFQAEPHASAILEVRYEYRDALVRLGVLPAGPDRLSRRERARGFEEPEFAPDPFRR